MKQLTELEEIKHRMIVDVIPGGDSVVLKFQDDTYYMMDEKDFEVGE